MLRSALSMTAASGTMAGMKFSLSPAGGSTAEIVAAAKQAEELGYDAFWVADSHVLRREVYVVLAAVACSTQRIALGPGVTHP